MVVLDAHLPEGACLSSRGVDAEVDVPGDGEERAVDGEW